MIQIRELKKCFGKFQALHDINIDIKNGGIYGLIGQSGSGKSTLLRCINGLIPYDGGRLSVDNVEVSSLSGRKLLQFRRKIGMIFQSFSLLNRLNIYDNIALPMRCWGYSRGEIEQRVSELLDMVHIAEKRSAFPSELSGGQKQRVAIARALAMKPEILLCDEATSALDPSIAETIMELLVEINHSLGITIIMVTHQLSMVKRYCENVYILEGGTVAAGGSCTEIFSDPPHALQVIMGEIDTLTFPKNGKNLHILLPSNKSAATLFSEMSIQTGIRCQVISASEEQFANETLFSLFLHIEESDYPVIAAYLQEQNLTWKLKEGMQ